MRMCLCAAALALGAALAADQAGAQDIGTTRAVSFGIAGGATVPVGDVSDTHGTGFNLMAMLNVQPAFVPVGVRFDAMYHSLPGKETLAGALNYADLRVIAGNANVVLTVSNTGTVRPYVIGGIGVYNLDTGGSSSESVTKFGLNGGGDIEFAVSGFNTFVEGRFHSIFTEGGKANLVPVVFGFRF